MNKKQKLHLNYLILATGNNTDLQKMMVLENGSERYQTCRNLEPGLYECSIPSDNQSVNAPADINGVGYIAEINVTKGQSGRKQIILTQSNRNNIWSKVIHTNGDDKGWTQLIHKAKNINLQMMTVPTFIQDLEQ